MEPPNLVGQHTWSKLQQGEVITGAANGEFETQRLTWFRKITRLLNPFRWFRSSQKPLIIVNALAQRTVMAVSTESLPSTRIAGDSGNLRSLKMAVAGIVKIKGVAKNGALITAPDGPVNKDKIQKLCQLSDSPRELINNIKDDKTRAKLRVAHSDSLLKADLEQVEGYEGALLPEDSWQSQRQKEIKAVVGDSVKSALYALVDETSLTTCAERIKNAPSVQVRVRDQLQYQIDLLMLRASMARAGLITADDMEFVWKSFVEALKAPEMKQAVIAETFLKSPDSGTELMKMVRQFSIHGLVVKEPNPPEYSQHQGIVDQIYRPEMERADRSPGLRNPGNKCYYNSMIKLLANQFSMADLESMSSQPRPMDFMEQRDLNSGRVEEDVLAQRQYLYDGLIALLRSIKLCRAGLVNAEEVNQLNQTFVHRLSSCRYDPLIEGLFMDNTQEDAHEFALVVSKILNHTNNPGCSYNYAHQKQAVTGGAQYVAQSGAAQQRDTMITLPVSSGEKVSYEICLREHLKEEKIDYLWGIDSTLEIPEFRDIDAVLESNKKNLQALRENLEVFKRNVESFTEDDYYIQAVRSMSVNDQGYFEWPQGQGNIRLLVLPPWTTTTIQPALEVDEEQIQSMVLVPKIFTYGASGVKKLTREGHDFFNSAVDGMDIPVVNKAGMPVSLRMDIKGMSCHSGSSHVGHYVYLEKAVLEPDQRPVWVLNDDSKTTVIGDNQALKRYLKRSDMTPYVYHLNKQSVQPRVNGAIARNHRYSSQG